MVTQVDHLTALFNQYRRERDELLAQAKRKEELMASVQELIRDKSSGRAPALELHEQVKPAPTKEKIPVSRLLDEFVKDASMPREFTAPQAVQYINSRGYYGENLYSSTFETLRRKVSKGELTKEGSTFKVPEGESSNDGASQG